MTSNPASVGPAPDGLLPCPFCGTVCHNVAWPRIAADSQPVAIIECFTDGCYARIEASTPSAARAAWNTRAPHPDREAEPTGGVVEGVRLLLADLTKGRDKRDPSDPVHAEFQRHIDTVQALSVSPPVVEGSSAEGADTQPGASLTVLDKHQLRAVEHAAMDAGAYSWRRARLAMVEDGKIIGYTVFSRADMAELARLYREPKDRHQPTTPGEQGEG